MKSETWDAEMLARIIGVTGLILFSALLMSLSGCGRTTLQEYKSSAYDRLPPSFAGVVSVKTLSNGSATLELAPALDNNTKLQDIVYKVYQSLNPNDPSTRKLLATVVGETHISVPPIPALTAAGSATLVIEATDQAGNRTEKECRIAPPPPPPVVSTTTTDKVTLTGRVINRVDGSGLVYIGLLVSTGHPMNSPAYPFAVVSGRGSDIPYKFEGIPIGTKVWVGAYLDSHGRGMMGPLPGDTVGFWPSFDTAKEITVATDTPPLDFIVDHPLVMEGSPAPTVPAPSTPPNATIQVIVREAPAPIYSPTPIYTAPPISVPAPTYLPLPTGTITGVIDLNADGRGKVLYITLMPGEVASPQQSFATHRVENPGTTHYFSFGGVPADRKYGIIAYLDANNNGAQDPDEMWGTAGPVYLAANGKAEVKFALAGSMPPAPEPTVLPTPYPSMVPIVSTPQPDFISPDHHIRIEVTVKTALRPGDEGKTLYVAAFEKQPNNSTEPADLKKLVVGSLNMEAQLILRYRRTYAIVAGLADSNDRPLRIGWKELTVDKPLPGRDNIVEISLDQEASGGQYVCPIHGAPPSDQDGDLHARVHREMLYRMEHFEHEKDALHGQYHQFFSKYGEGLREEDHKSFHESLEKKDRALNSDQDRFHSEFHRFDERTSGH